MCSTQYLCSWGTVINLLQFIAVLISGIWIFWHFKLFRNDKWNLEISVETNHFPYNTGHSLVSLKFSLKNIGKVKISPGKQGFTASIREIPKEMRKNGIIIWENLPSGIDKFDILKTYEHRPNRKYELEPNCTYHEILNIILEKNRFYFLLIEFWWKDDKDGIREYHLIKS